MDRGFKRGARRTSCWLAGVALAFALPLQAAETLKYAILVDGGKPAGQQVTVFEDDGRVRTDFIFKDNGRGPELKEEYRLAADMYGEIIKKKPANRAARVRRARALTAMGRFDEAIDIYREMLGERS